ncbi:hypothetical protein [Flavobacterium chungangense]|uniref:Uncharacterized protein n=1 Tax=Flavobacterium chungangense TaxID=554283 RepID=A0A6V6YXT5_9FLAO|nr:hypothetical protein [Flavobacterium chungangense]CAD0004337.1 hypothetical protein FLACHUCJ7_01823 [Flavobacterium chungangense]
MKSILLVIMFVLSVENYAQVAVTPSERGANEEFKKGQLENFKTTTTVFVLPETYKKEEYEKVLKEVWTVTSFKVVDFKDFKHLDFVNGSYSFAEIFGDLLRTSSGTMYLHTNLGIKVLSKEKFEKEFRKLKTDDKNYDKKLRDVINESLSYVARIPLCPTNEFLRNALGSLDLMKLKFPEEKMGKLYGEMYAKVSFTNVNLGMLKNYFQQINQIITKGEHCGLYEDFVNPKIKNLKESILYIPEVYMMKYDAWRFSETLRDEKEIKKLLEDYKYKFQFIKDEDLEKKILDNQDIYYLRYVSMNGNKYLQIVNAKSGDPAYYIYDAMSYNLKDDDFKKINKAIEAK